MMKCLRPFGVAAIALAHLACSEGVAPPSATSDAGAAGVAGTLPQGGPAGSSGGGASGASEHAGSSDIASAGSAGETGGAAGSGSGGGAGGGSGPGPVGKVLLFEDFDQAELPTSLGLGAQDGATVELASEPAQTYGGSGKSLRANYPLPTGGVYAWGILNIAAEQTRDLWVRFRARLPSSAPQGLKFFKVFGGSESGYANTTFGLDYTGVERGCMYNVSFGDGTFTENDTANILLFDGSQPELVGRAFGKPGYSAVTPQKSFWSADEWGTQWHLFELHVKFNSGTSAETEVNDGEIFVRIDGKVYADAKGLFNRHPRNGPIERVEILGWAQSGTAPFEIWYDNVEIAVGGFGDSPV